MKRWDWSKSRIWVWGSSLFVAGLILYAGYRSNLAESVQEKANSLNTTRSISAVTSLKSVNMSDEETAKQNSSKINKSSSSLPEQAKVKNGLTIGDFPSPVKGKVLKGIGYYYSEALQSYVLHEGVDYAEPEGAVIRATHGGKVIFAGQDSFLGQKVTLDCGEGWVVTYGSLENLSVQLGETVEKLDRIGQVGFYSGAEGSSGQTQLHYEVWHNHEVQSPKF